jgi:O-antigen/teichoic acid export membrane protein
LAKQASAFVLGAYIARRYGADGRGIYFLLTAGASILGVCLSLGINNSVIYHLKQGKLSVAQALLAVLLNSLAVSCVIALLMFFPGKEVGALMFKEVPFTAAFMAFLVAYVPVVLMTLFLTSYYMAMHEIRSHRLLVAIAPLATLAVTVASGQVMKVGVGAALCVLFAVEFLVVAGFSVHLMRTAPRIPGPRASMASLYSYSLRGFPGTLGSTILTQVDALVVAAFHSPTVVGFYAVAKSLYRLMLSIPQAFSGLLFGTYANLGAEEAGRFNSRVIRMMGTLLGAVAVPAFLLGGPFIVLVYGEEFAPAIPAFKILLFAALMIGSSSSLVPLFMAKGRPGLLSGITLAAGSLSVILTFVLVPRFALEGAASASLVGAACFTGLRLYFGRRLLRAVKVPGARELGAQPRIA